MLLVAQKQSSDVLTHYEHEEGSLSVSNRATGNNRSREGYAKERAHVQCIVDPAVRCRLLQTEILKVGRTAREGKT
jgi:hypothetical protein